MIHTPPPHPPAIINFSLSQKNTQVTPPLGLKSHSIPTTTSPQKALDSAKPTPPEQFTPESSVANAPEFSEASGHGKGAGYYYSTDVNIFNREYSGTEQLGSPMGVSVSNPAIEPETLAVPESNPVNLNHAIAPPVSPEIIPPPTQKLNHEDEKNNLVEPTPSIPELATTSPDSSTPTDSEPLTLDPSLSPVAQIPDGFIVFPVGLNVNKRNIVSGLLIRGQEDGSAAINFDQWFLPYDALVRALKLTTKVLPDNQIELSSSVQTVRINPSKLQTDPQLGLVFSVAQVQELFQVEVEFDIIEYAIQITAPWLNQRNPTRPQRIPIQTEGLPRIAANGFSLAAVEQRIDANSRQTLSPSYRGNLTAVGSIFGGSWLIRANQPDFFDRGTWRLAEVQYQRQTDASDYILGSQPPFWRSQSAGDYWGFTTIQRQGFIPKLQLYGENNPNQRLQAAQMSRTISGEAEPGTLVRLVQGLSNQIIGEVLVDSSGIYRFENIEFDPQGVGGYYRVFLYPQANLTEQPEIRDATFSNVPGRIPAGTTALIASGGWRRQLSAVDSGILGDFNDFQGGVLGRWGVSNSLTVGVGAVYDESLRGLGEVFFQPEGFPLKVAVSALSGTEESDWDINADILYEPSRNFTARFTRDRFSDRLNLSWQVSPGFTLLGSTDSRNGTAGGVQFAFSSKNAFTFARVTFDSESRLRWNLWQRLHQFELRSIGNEVNTQSELRYNFGRNNFDKGHSLGLGFDTYNQSQNDHLTTLSWRYRSHQQSQNGLPLWDAELGYGVGSRGSGLIASVGTTLIPGLQLRGRYQGISATSDESSFSVQLVSSLNLQRGLTAGDARTNYFRTQGGVMIQAFFDHNQNGQKDPGEKGFSDPNLAILNSQLVSTLRPDIKDDRIMMRLPPGTYRLDLDPAGFPVDWQAPETAYAVDVVAGSYTPVDVPLIPSYTRSGIVTDAAGRAIAGARVEAIHTDSGKRMFSVTNAAGVYYLESLTQGTYQLNVNGKSVDPLTLILTRTSEPFQELNLQRVGNGEQETGNSVPLTSTPNL